MASKTKTYSRSYEKVFGAVIQAAVDCGFNKESIDRSTGRINLSTGASLWSWGERIDIEVSIERGTKVSMSSTPEAQLMDWGKSSKNIDKLFIAIEGYL